ncbi:hypothetical protein HBI25_125120 [Parastagonospora nodorum]|nr:hypothetical protein HBH52_101120 [Parastagonospora nodorum]KAH4035063.1 hypothetical protein HBI09_094790 [Parastagonospora nodorum]KAH4065986.1 hypothetical protein HBH50_153210 [Parastagonospora nodorum]KAH4079529.1 hypothetical protein HBH48_220000 [Parastagonospora nodorum]KAH4115966.1 hypothetical protein HBH47_173950 [Parastagonospora nodorum]
MMREKGTKMAESRAIFDHAITRPKKKAEAAGKRAAGVRKAEDKVTAELVKTKAAAENGEGRTSKEDC